MGGRLTVILTCSLLLTGSSVDCHGQAAGAPGEERGNRGEVLEKLAAAEAAFTGSESLQEVRLDYAKLLLETGQFERSREMLVPLLHGPERSLEAVHMAARLDYLVGDYASAAAMFLEVLERDPGNARALTGLVLTHYQTNEFSHCDELPQDVLENVRLPHLDLMLAFGDEAPWQLHWAEGPATVVPFVESEPLPVIEIAINGRHIAAIIDTGGDLLILDSETADSIGIEPVASMMGTFAGGLQSEVGFARADSLWLGGARLSSVPISVLPTRGLSLGDRPIEGIVGTAVLRQFLSTMDYPGGMLILRERSEEARRAFRAEVAGRVVEDVPFYIQSTHFLLTRGSLNGHDGLIFHVDSGLAGDPSFAAPEQTLEYVGIPVPEVEVRDDIVGGGGGGFATGAFPIEELGLGRLRQRDLVGSYGAQPPGSYRRLGFIQDGLVSHNFLKSYAWTLDFDGMRMIFVK
jgi:hypothetical protein